MAPTIKIPGVKKGYKNRLLILVSAPLVIESENGLVPVAELQVNEEVDAIHRAIELHSDEFGFEIIVEHVTPFTFRSALTSKHPPAILHFIGHGTQVGEDVALVLEDSTGLAQILSTETLKD